jgi:hypothetical protein
MSAHALVLCYIILILLLLVDVLYSGSMYGSLNDGPATHARSRLGRVSLVAAAMTAGCVALVLFSGSQEKAQKFGDMGIHHPMEDAVSRILTKTLHKSRPSQKLASSNPRLTDADIQVMKEQCVHSCGAHMILKDTLSCVAKALTGASVCGRRGQRTWFQRSTSQQIRAMTFTSLLVEGGKVKPRSQAGSQAGRSRCVVAYSHLACLS